MTITHVNYGNIKRKQATRRVSFKTKSCEISWVHKLFYLFQPHTHLENQINGDPFVYRIV